MHQGAGSQAEDPVPGASVRAPDMEGVRYAFPGGFSPAGSLVVVQMGLEGERADAEFFVVDIDSGEG